MMTPSFEESLTFGYMFIYSAPDKSGGNTRCWFGTSVSLHSDILTLISFVDATRPVIHKHDHLFPCPLTFELSFCFISLLTGQ